MDVKQKKTRTKKPEQVRVKVKKINFDFSDSENEFSPQPKMFLKKKDDINTTTSSAVPKKKPVVAKKKVIMKKINMNFSESDSDSNRNMEANKNKKQPAIDLIHQRKSRKSVEEDFGNFQQQNYYDFSDEDEENLSLSSIAYGGNNLNNSSTSTTNRLSSFIGDIGLIGNPIMDSTHLQPGSGDKNKKKQTDLSDCSNTNTNIFLNDISNGKENLEEEVNYGKSKSKINHIIIDKSKRNQKIVESPAEKREEIDISNSNNSASVKVNHNDNPTQENVEVELSSSSCSYEEVELQDRSIQTCIIPPSFSHTSATLDQHCSDTTDSEQKQKQSLEISPFRDSNDLKLNFVSSNVSTSSVPTINENANEFVDNNVKQHPSSESSSIFSLSGKSYSNSSGNLDDLYKTCLDLDLENGLSPSSNSNSNDASLDLEEKQKEGAEEKENVNSNIKVKADSNSINVKNPQLKTLSVSQKSNRDSSNLNSSDNSESDYCYVQDASFQTSFLSQSQTQHSSSFSKSITYQSDRNREGQVVQGNEFTDDAANPKTKNQNTSQSQNPEEIVVVDHDINIKKKTASSMFLGLFGGKLSSASQFESQKSQSQSSSCNNMNNHNPLVGLLVADSEMDSNSNSSNNSINRQEGNDNSKEKKPESSFQFVVANSEESQSQEVIDDRNRIKNKTASSMFLGLFGRKLSSQSQSQNSQSSNCDINKSSPVVVGVLAADSDLDNSSSSYNSDNDSNSNRQEGRHGNSKEKKLGSSFVVANSESENECEESDGKDEEEDKEKEEEEEDQYDDNNEYHQAVSNKKKIENYDNDNDSSINSNISNRSVSRSNYCEGNENDLNSKRYKYKEDQNKIQIDKTGDDNIDIGNEFSQLAIRGETLHRTVQKGNDCNTITKERMEVSKAIIGEDDDYYHENESECDETEKHCTSSKSSKIKSKGRVIGNEFSRLAIGVGEETDHYHENDECDEKHSTNSSSRSSNTKQAKEGRRVNCSPKVPQAEAGFGSDPTTPKTTATRLDDAAQSSQGQSISQGSSVSWRGRRESSSSSSDDDQFEKFLTQMKSVRNDEASEEEIVPVVDGSTSSNTDDDDDRDNKKGNDMLFYIETNRKLDESESAHNKDKRMVEKKSYSYYTSSDWDEEDEDSNSDSNSGLSDFIVPETETPPDDEDPNPTSDNENKNENISKTEKTEKTDKENKSDFDFDEKAAQEKIKKSKIQQTPHESERSTRKKKRIINQVSGSANNFNSNSNRFDFSSSSSSDSDEWDFEEKSNKKTNPFITPRKVKLVKSKSNSLPNNNNNDDLACGGNISDDNNDDDDNDFVFVEKGTTTPTPKKKSQLPTTTVFKTPKQVNSASDVFKTPIGKNKPVLTHPWTAPRQLQATSSTSTSNDREQDDTAHFLKSLSQHYSDYKRHSDATRYIKQFKSLREDLTKKLFHIFNEKIFDSKIPSTIDLNWNVRYRKTAGTFSYKRSDPTVGKITLSVKVCDRPERVRDTLAHELCHAAVRMINQVDESHGPVWKSWARKVNHAFPFMPVVARCHDYLIHNKYTYQCVNCKYRIGRHSKSIDTEKKVCGHCKGTFQVFLTSDLNRTTSSTGTGSESATPKTPRTPNKFALFVKECYSEVKKKNTGFKHGDIMKELSKDFAEKNKIK